MSDKRDVILSTRIRFARNLKAYPFTGRLDETGAREIIDKVSSALGEEYKCTDFSKLDKIKAQSYAERRIVSREFALSKLPCVLLSKDDTHVMVNEEDHIRIQTIKEGFDLEGAFEEACNVDNLLLEKLDVAYTKELGFLTHCPTNLGTGMRASVMAFLPCLTVTKEISSIINQMSKLGLTVRGMYGEGSEAGGYLYQISNTQTLGCDEISTINKLREITEQIVKYEKDARKRLQAGMGASLTDRLTRSLGTMLYAYKISSEEFIKLYANVRLGIELDIIKDVDKTVLDQLLPGIMPASLSLQTGAATEEERDIRRAQYVQKILKK